MFIEKDFKKQYDRCIPLYYKENFEGKTLQDALYETLRKEILTLTQSYTSLGMFKVILIALKKQKNLDPLASEMLDEYIKGVTFINDEIYDIIKPLTDGLNVTIS